MEVKKFPQTLTEARTPSQRKIKYKKVKYQILRRNFRQILTLVITNVLNNFYLIFMCLLGTINIVTCSDPLKNLI